MGKDRQAPRQRKPPRFVGLVRSVRNHIRNMGELNKPPRCNAYVGGKWAYVTLHRRPRTSQDFPPDQGLGLAEPAREAGQWVRWDRITHSRAKLSSQETLMPVAVDLRGARFSRLVVIERASNRGVRKARWRCRCDCGGEATCTTGNLRSGNSKSCGCLNRAKSAQRARQRSTKHGHSSRAVKSPEYRSWAAMHGRCRYPCVRSFEYYGGKGIKVCRRWASFDAFLEDMGPKPSPTNSIDRIDANGDYEPSNCRWATALEQAQNRQQARLSRGEGA